MSQQTKHKIVCKYGLKCKYLINNTCQFYHPHQNSNYQHTRSNINDNSQQYCQNTDRRGMSQGKKSNLHQQGNIPFKNQPHFIMHRNPSFGGKMQQNHQRSLCKFYHLGNTCEFGQKCKRKHQFIFGGSPLMRRIIHRRDIPQNSISRMCKIEGGEDENISIKLGNQVYRLRYELQSNELAGGQKVYQLPAINGKYEYYMQRNEYIYYSSQNQTTKFADFGFHNCATGEIVWISNSHSTKVTGILHYDQDTLYSSSLAGDIKVWHKSQQQGYIFNKKMTEYILSTFNPQNKTIQILFLNIETVQDTKLMSAGTNDGRLLFWGANNTTFMQFHVQGYNKVYKAKTIQINGIYGSIILAWNTNTNSSAVLLLNLQSGERVIVKQVNGANTNNFAYIHTFQYIEDYIFIGNIRGDVSIYDIRQEVKQIGAIRHQNMISDIICSNVRIKATGVSLKIIYILEKREQKIEGSFSIYMIQ